MFLSLTGGVEELKREVFLTIPCISANPLKERLLACFGFGDRHFLIFKEFILGLSLFNSPGNRDQKLKLSFRLHDFDEDNQISQEDLKKYVTCITGNMLPAEDVDDIVKNVFEEFATSNVEKVEFISFSDFQRVVAPLDFQAKLNLPI